MINAMNGDRSASGLGQLCGNAALNGYAQSWANWMAQNQSLTHQDLGAVLAGTAFNNVAENILMGPGGMSSGQMEAAWMASPGHRQNILNGVYTAAGVACVQQRRPGLGRRRVRRLTPRVRNPAGPDDPASDFG